jgi:hypothetical protein
VAACSAPLLTFHKARHGNCVLGIGFVVALHGVEDGESFLATAMTASFLEPDRAAIAL